ncbi:unnamed protein product [Pedinophyceae sp. YPF-701]|nr:unnamed protein product [Pedinophyceae sp. YPF-701]
MPLEDEEVGGWVSFEGAQPVGGARESEGSGEDVAGYQPLLQSDAPHDEAADGGQVQSRPGGGQQGTAQPPEEEGWATFSNKDQFFTRTGGWAAVESDLASIEVALAAMGPGGVSAGAATPATHDVQAAATRLSSAAAASRAREQVTRSRALQEAMQAVGNAFRPGDGAGAVGDAERDGDGAHSAQGAFSLHSEAPMPAAHKQRIVDAMANVKLEFQPAWAKPSVGGVSEDAWMRILADKRAQEGAAVARGDEGAAGAERRAAD